MALSESLTKYKRACISGYCIRCIYGLYVVLRSKNKSNSFNQSILSKMKQIFFTLEHYQFAGCIASATATYSFITRFLLTKSSVQPSTETNPNKNGKKMELKIKILAITISMIWFKALPKQFREMVVLHLFVRAVYDLIKLYKYDDEYRILPHIPYDEVWIGALPFTVMGYGIYHNPWLFDEGFYKFILKWGSNTHEQIGHVFRSQKDPLSHVRLRGEPFVECVPLWHAEPSCFKFHFANIWRDAIRSSSMYAFVHLSSLLISPKFYKMCYKAIRNKRKDVVNTETKDKFPDKDYRTELMKLLIRKCIAVARSSMFFVCVQHFSKLMQCYWRHYVLRADPVWSSLAIVYISTALAEFFETPQRRIQYTLYVSTQVMRMIAKAIRLKYGDSIKQNKALRWVYEWWSVILFQITFAIWCFIKGIGRSETYCTKWSITAMNTVL
eukprot:246884_1